MIYESILLTILLLGIHASTEILSRKTAELQKKLCDQYEKLGENRHEKNSDALER